MSARRAGLSRRGRAGQGLVEFALALPVFLLVLFGLIDLGRLVYLQNTLSQVAREGARVGSVEASWVGKTGPACGAPVCPADTSALKADVLAAANRMAVGLGTISSAQLTLTCDLPAGSSPSTNCASNNSSHSVLTVAVAMTFRPITPFVGQFITDVPMSATTSMVIN